MPLTPDQYADRDEYLADQEYDRLKYEHERMHNGDVDECRFCRKEMRQSSDGDRDTLRAAKAR